VFQDAAGSLTPHRSVGSLCREAARPGFDIARLAEAIGLERGALARRARELSGGQQRRAAVLRAVCAEPRALLLDEPTAGLDAGTARRMVGVLRDWLVAHRAASLWITHDDELAESIADRTLRIEEGRLC
jgi:peptide/nickel transport system ATP-binding protein